MRPSTIGLLATLGLLAWGCTDDTTGDDTAAASSGSPTSGSGDASTGHDHGTTGGSGSGSAEGSSGMGSSGTSAGQTASSGSADGSGTVADTGLVGSFPCGMDLECDLATQYCQQTVGGAVGNPPSYTCIDLPDGCAGGSCECLAGEPCGSICELIEGGAQLTCQAP